MKTLAVHPDTNQGMRTLLRVAAAGGLLIAAVIHLALAPGHLASSPLLGLGFLASGLAQAVLAGAMLVSPSRPVLLAAMIVSALALAAYAVDVTVGLPGLSHAAVSAGSGTHSDPAHIPSASGPTVDIAALVTKASEALTLIAATVLYGRR